MALLLVACKTELYTGLSEREANEMYALLSERGIDVDKRMVKDKKVTKVDILVESSDIAEAMSILTSQGYPREQYVSMGEVFAKAGMISSPMEEKARYNFAISQELRETLSRIDGVLEARVHVVLPTETRSNESPAPSSASVFIKHIDGMPVENLTPKVKSLVANSVEGLNYSSVSVVLFPSIPIEKRSTFTVENNTSNSSGISFSSPLTLGIIAVVIALIAAIGVLLYQLSRKRS